MITPEVADPQETGRKRPAEYEPPEASGPHGPDQTTDHRLESAFGTLVTWAQALRSRQAAPAAGDPAAQTIVDDLLARVEGRPRHSPPA